MGMTAEIDWRCIGFDIKVWPWAGPYTIDSGEWEAAEAAIGELRDRQFLKDNIFQLFDVASYSLLGRVIKDISCRDDCNLLSVEIPSEIYDFLGGAVGKRVQTIGPSVESFTFLGLDICDIDGLFSILHNPALLNLRGGRALFPEDRSFEALRYAQLSNFIDRNHAPLSLVRIGALKVPLA